MIVFDIFMRAIPSLNLRNIIKNEFWKVQNVVHHNILISSFVVDSKHASKTCFLEGRLFYCFRKKLIMLVCVHAFAYMAWYILIISDDRVNINMLFYYI